MRITVLGAGKVGIALARIWSAAGHTIVLTYARDAAALEDRAREVGGAAVADPAAACGEADAVLLAVPWDAAAGALQAAALAPGTVLIDATNALGAAPAPSPSGAEAIAAMAPGVHVVKAFNTVFQQMFAVAAAQPGQQSMVFCGDDAAAKETVATIVRDTGFDPIDAGGLSQAADIEALARLVIGIAYRQGRGPFTYRFS